MVAFFVIVNGQVLTFYSSLVFIPLISFFMLCLVESIFSCKLLSQAFYMALNNQKNQTTPFSPARHWSSVWFLCFSKPQSVGALRIDDMTPLYISKTGRVVFVGVAGLSSILAYESETMSRARFRSKAKVRSSFHWFCFLRSEIDPNFVHCKLLVLSESGCR